MSHVFSQFSKLTFLVIILDCGLSVTTMKYLLSFAFGSPRWDDCYQPEDHPLPLISRKIVYNPQYSLATQIL